MTHRSFLTPLIVVTSMQLGPCQTITDTYDRQFYGARPAQPPAELVTILPTATPKVRWQGSAGTSEKNIFFAATSDNIVYAANAPAADTAFDATKGGAARPVAP